MKKYLLLLGSLSLALNCFGAAATMYVTASGAGAKDGSSWANAMGLAEWETDAEGSTEAGDIYYVMGGQTYTLTGDFTVANDGTVTDPIKIIGVASGTTAEPPTYTDWAAGDDRPLITDGASDYTFTWDDYAQFFNLRMTGSDSVVSRADTGALYYNCAVLNDSASTGRSALSFGYADATAIFCDVACTNGVAIDADYGGDGHKAIFNYIHDSDYGYTLRLQDTAIFNVFDTIATTAVNFANDGGNLVAFNTFYSGGTAIASNDEGRSVIIGNIISGFTSGASWTTEQKSNLFDYNDWHSNTADVSNATKGPNAKAVDPQFDNAAGGDFDIGANLDDLGPDQPGDVGSAHLEIGACMYEETAGAGGGGGTSHVLVY